MSDLQTSESTGYSNKKLGCCRQIGVRHKQLAFLLPGLLLGYANRTNLSVAVVSMTAESSEFATVPWTTSQKGFLLGMFFYGYVTGGIIFGYIANKLSPSKALAVAAIFCGLITTTFPFLATTEFGFSSCCISRALQGLGQASFMPCLAALISKWAAPSERGRINSVVCSGVALGTTVMMSTGGLLAASPLGWPSIFYFSGTGLTVWGLLCYQYVVDSPREHRTISDWEKTFIESSNNMVREDSGKLGIPWAKILISVPCWAMIIGGFAFNWGFWTLLTMMPSYLNSILRFEITKNGFMSALANLGMFFGCLIFPVMDSFLENHFKLPVGFHRKFWQSVTLYGCACVFLVLAFTEVGPTTAVVLLVTGSTLNAAVYHGHLCNPLDLSPNFAGMLMGYSNTLNNVASILSPTVAGLLLHDENNLSQWQNVFLLGAIIFIIGNTIFLIFGSGDVQSWNDVTQNKPSVELSKIGEQIKKEQT